MEETTINALRAFFRITNAAFDFQQSIQLSLYQKVTHSKMQQLHRIALAEIEKDNFDLKKIEALLLEMEKTAELNK